MIPLLLYLLLMPGSPQMANFPALDISNNWWGSTGPPINYTNWNYAIPATTFLLTGPPPAASSFLVCGSLNDVVGHGRIMPARTLSNVDTTSCYGMLDICDEEETDGLYDQAYDTVCHYLSHCYAEPYAAGNEAGFGALVGAAADTTLTQIGRTSMRSFLLSVLPLRSDDAWFCNCVEAIGASFRLDTNSTREGLSLLYWLMNNPRCSAYRAADSGAYFQERFDDSSLWIDTTHWPDTVYDTTLLTMQQMGLDSVLKISATEGVSPEAIGSQILLNAHITTNPFMDATNISLSIGREAYVTIIVYNVLGVQIAGAGYAGVFEQGSATIPINMTNAPPGAYFVRISTANNETQTLKLTKE
jgi:Secretion system C-terminal sorting domain